MASKAFTAVARSVHTVMTDPDDDTGRRRLFGTPKNNLGRNDLPTLSFVIESTKCRPRRGQPIPANCYGQGCEISIFEATRRAAEDPEKGGSRRRG